VTKPAVELLLGRHTVYRLFRKLTGSDNVNREFVLQYVRPESGDEILDIGCGPADVFELMPQARYTGIDLSENYIASARRRFGNRAAFLCADLASLEQQRRGSFDRIICMGVMHHLSDDKVEGMLKTVCRMLKPNGRFISYDPCFTEPQHPVARWIHRHDRGQFVRFVSEYEALISRVFDSYRMHIRTDMCRVPSTVVIFECDYVKPR
jgi:cyclopropane fatty-acyl-phospholipid synthase-like methyltransferase